jgi:putative exosortase-associated protein (TIGR04073 family)
MKKYSFALLSLLLVSLLMGFSPIIRADDAQPQNVQEESYGDKVGDKALSGFTNLNTAILEIPKNIINTTNQSNIAYGFTGGLAKGILNTVGRMVAGLADLITAPLLTKPIPNPNYIWDNFDADTTYGQSFRLDNEPENADAMRTK